MIAIIPQQLNSSPIALSRVKWRHIMLCSRQPQTLWFWGIASYDTNSC